jgi:Mg-chelatase subunit ChlD
MIQFQYPELFLLAIPLSFAYRRFGLERGFTGVLRITLLALLLLSLTGPRWNLGGEGIDIVVVADRSRSLPDSANEQIRELIRDLEKNRKSGDRIGLVTFGTRAEVEHTLSLSSELGAYTRDVIPDGSDLNDAIATALNLIDPNRPARVLVMSDGEANGASPLSAARRAREVGVPIDFRLFERNRIGDLAIESLTLPDVVFPREPFQFAVWVHASRAAHGVVRVLRDGQEIAKLERDFVTGLNRIPFRDLLEVGGLTHYTAELLVDDDPLTENNRGAGVVRVETAPRVLVLNDDGQEDNLVRALQAARLPVDVVAGKTHPLTQDSLEVYRAVILENIPAEHLGRRKMERLAQWVEDLGGGLLVTGGERSFGVGGYFKSPLDDILPVSMELREEHRKNRVAIAVALDRSGSMSMPVKGGKLKMDLANLGTAACINLLSPSDKIAVLAVDSAPHVVQSMRTVDDKEAIISKVLSIQSMGGGIYVYEALVAAGEQLMQAGEYTTRHIILFSDAQDSEEPGAYPDLLKKFADAGITVSVIGLGTENDVHAPLLKDIAKLGGGSIKFTDDPEELPRVFAEDTMRVARNTFIKHNPDAQDNPHPPDGIHGRLLPDARLMGELGHGPFPPTKGYNLSYLKPNATEAVVSTDEYNAPWLAFWYRGLGRVAALSIEVDGPHTGPFGTWEGYADFLVTQARWLLNSASPDDVFLTLKQEGQEAIATVELDPERGDQHRTDAPTLYVVPPGDERTQPITPDFVWTGPHSLQARFRLEQTGTYRTLVRAAGKDSRQFVRGPTVTLPYSPEFAPRQGVPSGREILSEVAKLSNGRERTDILSVLSDPPRSVQTRSLLPWLFLASLIVLMLEIAGRRLSWWETFPWWRWKRIAPAIQSEAREPPTTEPQPAWWKSLLPSRVKRREVAVTKSTTTAPREADPRPFTPPKTTPKTGSVSAAELFEQAKRRASNRLK